MCPSVVTHVPLTCNAGNHLLHINPLNKTCSAAARAIKNLASGVVGNEVGDIDCVDDRYFRVKDRERCEETVLALNTVYQYHENGRGNLTLDYEECNDPTTQTTTATSTATSAVFDSQCAFASWQSKQLLVHCAAYNTRWYNRLLQKCGGFEADDALLACKGGRLISATAEMCTAQVAVLNEIARDVSYNADPVHVPFTCGNAGNVVTYYTQDTKSCSADVELLDKATHLLRTGQYDKCTHNTLTSTGTSSATSTQSTTGTSTVSSTATSTGRTTATTGRHCNGNPEADECAVLSETDCGRFMLPGSGPTPPPSSNSAAAFDVSKNCPALCNTCTTSTTTTTMPTCNGVPDPPFCRNELLDNCGTIENTIDVDVYCPAMCSSCIPTTSTTTETATTTTVTETTTTLDPVIAAQNGKVDIECNDFDGQQLVTVAADRPACHYRVAKALGVVAQGCLPGFPDPEALLECHAVSSKNEYVLYGGEPALCVETAVAIGAGLRSSGITAGFGCTSDGYLTMNTPCTGGMLAVAFAAAGNQQKMARTDPRPPGQPPFAASNRDCTPVIGDTGVRATFYFRQDQALEQLAGSNTWEQDAFKDTLAASLQSQLPGQGAAELGVLAFNPGDGEVTVEIAAPGADGGQPSAFVSTQLEALLASPETPFYFSFGGVALTSSAADGPKATAATGASTGLIVVLALIAALLVGVVVMLVSLKRSRKVSPQSYLLNHNFSVKELSVLDPAPSFDNN